ncbi:MAG: PcfJ domain-containing protein [Gammaproteobacteria bacterium]
MHVVAAVCNDTLHFSEVESVPLRGVCERIANGGLCKKEWPLLRDFIMRIWVRSKLPVKSEHRDGQTLYYIDALISVYRLRESWIRPLDDWRPKTHNREKQFLSLVRHLLVSYKVPEFFESVWFRRDDSAQQYQQWYVDIGAGQSMREGPSPIPLTKKTAHHFMHAPRGYSIEQAVRFGQIRALGGSRKLCAAVIETRLGADFSNDLFWQSVLRFFIANPTLDLTQVGPVIDFLYHQKFEQQELQLDGGAVRRVPPPQPNLSMQKRTLTSLQTQVDEWHERLGKVKVDAAMRWSASTIRPAAYVRGKDDKQIIWRINELLSQKELLQEGRALKHCVVRYSSGCLAGRTSIWSLTREDACGNVRRSQTIEVSRHKKIVQCRGLGNRYPTEQERYFVRLWAKSEALDLALHGF